MPILRVVVVEGISDEKKSELFMALAQAVHRSVGAPLANVRIILSEVAAAHISVGGRTGTGVVPAPKP